MKEGVQVGARVVGNHVGYWEGRSDGASDGWPEGDHDGNLVGTSIVGTAVGRSTVGIMVGSRVVFNSLMMGPESVRLLIMTRSPAWMPPIACRDATTEKTNNAIHTENANAPNFKSVNFAR